MIDNQPIQDPMIPVEATNLTGIQKLEAARGDLNLEWRSVDVAIAGVVRKASKLPEFQLAAQEAGIEISSDEPWTVEFKIGEGVGYTISHDEVNRPTKHYFTGRTLVERTESDISRKATLCTIQGMKHETEPIHLGPKAELISEIGETLTGVDALIGLTDAFPELELIWQ